MAEVHEETPELPELWFVRCFVNGLREGIKFQVRTHMPQTITDAYWLAREIEPGFPPRKLSLLIITTLANRVFTFHGRFCPYQCNSSSLSSNLIYLYSSVSKSKKSGGMLDMWRQVDAWPQVQASTQHSLFGGRANGHNTG